MTIKLSPEWVAREAPRAKADDEAHTKLHHEAQFKWCWLETTKGWVGGRVTSEKDGCTTIGFIFTGALPDFIRIQDKHPTQQPNQSAGVKEA